MITFLFLVKSYAKMLSSTFCYALLFLHKSEEVYLVFGLVLCLVNMCSQM